MKKISVIIPSYNRKDMLCQAINSILNQTYENIEIIVIDDNSVDGTEIIPSLYPNIIYFKNNKNMGPGYSRQFGYNHSSGEYIIFMDDDDYYIDFNFFKNALLEFKENTIFVSANANILNISNQTTKEHKLNVLGRYDTLDYLNNFKSKYDKPVSTFTTIFNKNSLQAVGFESMKMMNDMSIYLRSLLNKGNIYIMSDIVGIYREHEKNISNSIKSNFLIDNLSEKLNILQESRDNNRFNKLFDYNKWWYFQVKTTLIYYVYESRPTIFQLKKIEKWLKKVNINNDEILQLFKEYYKFLLNYNIYDCKVFIYNILKKLKVLK